MSDEFPPGADTAGIGSRMLRLRTERGLTQAQVAGTSFTRAYVSSVEGGKRTPSRRTTAYFASRLSVDPDDLFFGYEAGRRKKLRQAVADARTALSRGEIERACEAYQQVVREADAQGDSELGYAGRCGLGAAARHQGDPDRALGLFREAEELLAAQPLTSRLQAVVGQMGAHFARGEIAQALVLAERHLLAAAGTDQDAAEFALRAASVMPLVERGELKEAGMAADKALEIAPLVKEPEVLAQGYYHINRALTAQGRCDQAEQVLSRALALYEHLSLRTEVGMCHFALGYLAARSGDLPVAETSLRLAASVFTETKSRPRLVNALAELAEVVRQQDRLEEAASLVGKCRVAAREYQDPEQAAELDRIDALIALDQGEEAACVSLFRSALAGYTDIEAVYEIAATCRLFGDALLGWGRVQEAAEVFRQGLTALERP
ncbi:helix-turn-helix domain-containing protein [Streptomyces sp. ISL-100]|uniref:helix-turn-helix domain-containing protein n=1 Tax=Streptomyces sp. ISL-100 TaxID=2819173 RepID=UPI001BE9E4FA|nr:helix-turn-helix domain-containing protein [Streptomyces sp. ISL-100]MBT2395408.1 helix-turn-helix domain-containing protein [Streptomyces sp. ISL-100]